MRNRQDAVNSPHRTLEGKGLCRCWHGGRELSVSIKLRPFVTPFHSVPPLKPSLLPSPHTTETGCLPSSLPPLSLLPTFKVESTFHLPPRELELPVATPLPLALDCLRPISRRGSKAVGRTTVAKLRLQSARFATQSHTTPCVVNRIGKRSWI